MIEDFINNGDGIRDQWQFDYLAGDVAIAAIDQMNHRQVRVSFWKKKQTEVMAEIKTSGIQITESIANGLTFGSGYATSKVDSGPQIAIDPKMRADLLECTNRISKHEEAVVAYDGWHQVLAANPKKEVKLTQADWLFFFGKL